MSTEFDAAAADCSDNANIHIPPPLVTTYIWDTTDPYQLSIE